MTTSVKTAAPGRVIKDDLTQQILDNRDDMRNARSFAIGKMLCIFLSPEDNATYALNPSVRERIASVTKVRGLQLEWPQSVAPNICWNHRRNGIVFPFGCPKPPRIADPRHQAAADKTISQNIEDYASGYIAGRDGSEFIVLQPVVYIGVWILAGLYNLVAHPDPVSGKYPALLMRPNTSEAHIVYGAFELTSARPGGAQPMPWQQPAA